MRKRRDGRAATAIPPYAVQRPLAICAALIRKIPMLSYRHAFHAGNHADVLKHLVLLQVLRYYNQKDKPYWFIDTHAGAGGYALQHGFAAQNAEHEEGVGRLWSESALPAALADYVAQVRDFNRGATLRDYPGSPALAQAVMRAEDRLRLFELHPTDAPLLARLMAPAARQASVRQEDGFAALKALLPPPTRRAVVLIDPPYELKADYGRCVETLRDALKRFGQGCYLIWYPLLARSDAQQLPERLRRLGAPAWLDVRLQVRQAPPDGRGMYGSGMFVINPPWTLPAMLQECLPVLVRRLALDAAAAHDLEYEIP